MDNILETIDFEKKYPTIKEESTTSNFGDILDTFVNETPKNDNRSMYTEFDNLSKANQDAFHESGFKYLLTKSPIENDSKKSSKSKKEIEEEEREKMQVLVSNFTEEQLDRYEMFRRAAFPKAAIKRIMQVITGNSVSQNVVIAMSGIAKVFVGEIVEEALDIMETQNDVGPLQPKHLREAVRRLRRKGRIPSLRDKKPNYRF